jgi:hypothetical protein
MYVPVGSIAKPPMYPKVAERPVPSAAVAPEFPATVVTARVAISIFLRYLPASPIKIVLYDESMHIPRGKFWNEAPVPVPSVRAEVPVPAKTVTTPAGVVFVRVCAVLLPV